MNITPGLTGNFFTVADNVSSSWIAFVTGAVPVINFSFDIISAVREPNVTVEFTEASDDSDPTECTTSNDRIFHCTRTLPLIGNYQLELEIEGGPADPTSWRLANFVSPSNFCLRLPNQELGVWSGGLEAFVPFVKGTDDRSYATYIKLFNRYNLPAKVFVSTFADNPGGSSDKIMVSTDQLPAPLDSIPAGDYITITDQDIGLFVPGYDMSKGLPVKFNIRVPSGIGTTGSIGSWNFLGETQADLTHQNPYDPFVEGIVISIYPVGGQRSIPLKFKGFKNGEYNH